MDVELNSITGVPTLKNYYKYITFNPILLTIIVVILILYFILFGSLGNSYFDESYGSDNNGFLKILGIIVASIFLILILINGFSYFFNLNIITSIKNFFTKNPEIDIVVDTEKDLSDSSNNVPEITDIKQVYHIPGNNYTYTDAKAICKAYGNRIANYKEVENSYKAGGDWCSYGWSENQMALFPTQSDKWDKLQRIKGHENDCGRPGINGGYIDNPNVRFGVNCYGYKPKITTQEAEIMKNTSLYPITKEEQTFNKEVDYWSTKVKDILVAPFNSKSWSKY